jgi:hypothetical protein
METSVYSSKNSAVAVTSILLLLFLLAFVLFIYTFLHESGHALIGLLFGQSLTDFTIDLLKMYLPFALYAGLMIKLRPTLLPYYMLVHALIDVSAVMVYLMI